VVGVLGWAAGVVVIGEAVVGFGWWMLLWFWACDFDFKKTLNQKI